MTGHHMTGHDMGGHAASRPAGTTAEPGAGLSVDLIAEMAATCWPATTFTISHGTLYWTDGPTTTELVSTLYSDQEPDVPRGRPSRADTTSDDSIAAGVHPAAPAPVPLNRALTYRGLMTWFAARHLLTGAAHGIPQATRIHATTGFTSGAFVSLHGGPGTLETPATIPVPTHGADLLDLARAHHDATGAPEPTISDLDRIVATARDLADDLCRLAEKSPHLTVLPLAATRYHLAQACERWLPALMAAHA